MSSPQLNSSEQDTKVVLYFTGGGATIVVSFLHALCIQDLCGAKYWSSCGDYHAGVSSGAVAAATPLIPKVEGSQEPLYPCFKDHLDQAISGATNIFDPGIGKHIFAYQCRAIGAEIFRRRFDHGFLRPLFNFLAKSGVLYFSQDNLKSFLDKSLVVHSSQREEEPRGAKISDLIRPVLIPVTIVSEKLYGLYANVPIVGDPNCSNQNAPLTDVLLDSTRLVPFFRPANHVDPGFQFWALDAVEHFQIPKNDRRIVIVFDCLTTDRMAEFPSQRGLLSQYFSETARTMQASRMAQQKMRVKLFKDQHPGSEVYVFSRLSPPLVEGRANAEVSPDFMNKFCQTHLGISYAETCQGPFESLGLSAVFSSESDIQRALVREAVVACVKQMPKLLSAATEIIRGPLARYEGLSTREQEERINGMYRRVYPNGQAHARPASDGSCAALAYSQ